MSNIAYRLATLVHSYCRDKWPDDGANMGSTAIDVALPLVEHDYCSHKYFDSDEATRILGMSQGAGTYGAFTFKDGSRAYVTCKGPLAVSGEGMPLRWVD